MTYSEEERKYVLQLYEPSGKNRNLASKLFFEKYNVKISIRTIGSYWDKAGFQGSPHGGQRNGMSEKEFMEIYNGNEGDISKMIDESGCQVSGLTRRCKSAGLPYKNTPRKKKREDASFLIEPDIIMAGRNGDFF